MKKTILLLIIIYLFTFSCKENEPTAPKLDIATKIIEANSGGTITTPDGIILEIPPGALLEDTEISLTSFKGTDMHEWGVSAVHLEPDGLILEKPARLSLPLPSEWPIDHRPLVFISFESDPAEYFNTGICAEIISSENGLSAQTEVSHFSKWGAVGNCHKGTLVTLLEKFEQMGCDDTTAWRKVKDKYPSVNTDITSIQRTGPATIQAFLGTYFQDIGGFKKNETVKDRWNEIKNYIKTQKKRVVVFFAKDEWGAQDTNRFFEHVSHSATLEMVGENLKLRNSISAGPKVLNALKNKNGENVIWYPNGNEDIDADKMDKFRNMRSYEAVEKELNTSPQLFSNLPALDKRSQPWTAVRFYVSKKSKDENPCGDEVQFKHCDIHISVIAIEDTNKWNWSPAWYTDGEFKDNVYNGSINTERQGGNAVGTIRIEVDNDFNIKTLNVMAYHTDEYLSSQWGFTAANVPPYENEPYLVVYNSGGTIVCSYVTSIYAKYTNPDESYSEYRNFQCEEESLLHIKFHNYD